MPGRGIIITSWVTIGIFAVAVIPDAVGAHVLDNLAVGVSLALFLVSLPIWLYAYGLAVTRTARGDDITVSSLFFLQKSAPREVQQHLLGAVGLSVAIAAATAAANPFSVLVPMLPLGLAGLWGARHGVYPPRPARKNPTGGRR
jgi:hypothetical protein